MSWRRASNRLNRLCGRTGHLRSQLLHALRLRRIPVVAANGVMKHVRSPLASLPGQRSPIARYQLRTTFRTPPRGWQRQCQPVFGACCSTTGARIAFACLVRHGRCRRCESTSRHMNPTPRNTTLMCREPSHRLCARRLIFPIERAHGTRQTYRYYLTVVSGQWSVVSKCRVHLSGLTIDEWSATARRSDVRKPVVRDVTTPRF